MAATALSCGPLHLACSLSEFAFNFLYPSMCVSPPDWWVSFYGVGAGSSFLSVNFPLRLVLSFCLGAVPFAFSALAAFVSLIFAYWLLLSS